MAALYPPLSPFSTGFRCRCPRCGEAPLFEGLLEVRAACPACGLDYGTVNSGDGPAVFVILIIGFVVVGLALWMEVTYSPPVWLHFVLWIPVTIGLCLWLLRALKALLIALQYRNNARQGEIDRG